MGLTIEAEAGGIIERFFRADWPRLSELGELEQNAFLAASPNPGGRTRINQVEGFLGVSITITGVSSKEDNYGVYIYQADIPDKKKQLCEDLIKVPGIRLKKMLK
jgi:hypothetical protein